MILCKKRNFAFLRIPKTASTSICAHLISHIPKSEIDEFWGVDFLTFGNFGYKYLNYFDDTGSPVIYWHEKISKLNPHCTRSDLLNANLIEDSSPINFYAVIRDPVDRFLSITNMFIEKEQRTIKENINFEVAYYLKKVESNNLKKRLFWFFPQSFGEEILFAPQISWIDQKINLLVYPKFETFFDKINVSKDFMHAFRVNKLSQIQRENLDKSLIQDIQRVYKKDVELWNSVSY